MERTVIREGVRRMEMARKIPIVVVLEEWVFF